MKEREELARSARHATLAIIFVTLIPAISLANSDASKKKPYRPKIFKPAEFRTLKVLTESILHDDEMPGARVAKANEFIDFQITYDPELQKRFHSGLRWLDNHSRRLYGHNFADLRPNQRRDIIQCLEVKKLRRPGEEKGREFFELARRYTYMGFYASEEALRIAIPKTEKLPATSGKKQVSREQNYESKKN